MAKDLPLRALKEVCWSFTGSPFTDREEFDVKVRRYQIRIRKKDSWQSNSIVIPVPRVAVRYQCWSGDEQIEPVLFLEADDGKSFGAGELLFKLHNAVVEQLRELDHHFFEGLTLSGWVEDGKIPLYQLRQGS